MAGNCLVGDKCRFPQLSAAIETPNYSPRQLSWFKLVGRNGFRGSIFTSLWTHEPRDCVVCRVGTRMFSR